MNKELYNLYVQFNDLDVWYIYTCCNNSKLWDNDEKTDHIFMNFE